MNIDSNGWHVEYRPTPIPIRAFDWHFWHDDCDDENGLSGFASSEADAEEQISVIEEENAWR